MNQNYQEIKLINWNDFKMPKLINIIVLVLVISSVFIGHFSFSVLLLVKIISQPPLILLAIPLTIVIYIAVHELIHGLLMKIYSEVNPDYGFSGPFILLKAK